MALPPAFQERLQQMEETRNQRLSLLQAEKELQKKKSLLLAAKLLNLQRIERHCLMLEQKNALFRSQILVKKYEIDTIDSKYQNAEQRFRDLKGEIHEIEEREKEKERYYEMKRLEMKEFKEELDSFSLESRSEVERMRNTVSELKSSLKDLQGKDGYLNNPDIAAEEMRKAELLVAKEKLDQSLASNYHLKSLLRKQLRNMLVSKDIQKGKVKQCGERQRSELAKLQ